MLDWSDSGIPGLPGEWATWGDYLLCVQTLGTEDMSAIAIEEEPGPCYYFVVDTVTDERILTGETDTLNNARALCARFCLLIQNVTEEQKAKIIKLSQFYS